MRHDSEAASAKHTSSNAVPAMKRDLLGSVWSGLMMLPKDPAAVSIVRVRGDTWWHETWRTSYICRSLSDKGAEARVTGGE